MTASPGARQPEDIATAGWDAQVGRWQDKMWQFSRPIKFSMDQVLWALAIPIAGVLRYETSIAGAARGLAGLLLIAVLIHPVIAYRMGFYRQSWGKIGLRDLRILALGVVFETLVLFLIASLTHIWDLGLPRSVPLIAGAVGILLLGGIRVATRMWWDWRTTRVIDGSGSRRVLIVGAGEAGTLLCREMLRHPESGLVPVGFLDDDPRKRNLLYQGVPVVGKLADIRVAVRSVQATELLFAIPSAKSPVRRAVVDAAEAGGIPLRFVPGIYDLLSSESPRRIREVLNSFVVKGRPKNVLIIGGGGYVGSALVPRLLERGYHVRILDLFIYSSDPVRPYLDHPNCEFIQGDFRQVHNVVEAIQGMDTVIHLGAIVGDPACALDEEITIEINLMATKMIAEVAKGYGISRFLFASTCSVYGASDDLLHEGSALNPLSLYARTKIASERVLLGMQDSSFCPTILRFGTVYGFSGRTRFDLVVNLLTAKAVTEGIITLYGGGQWRPFVHVHDVAKAILMTLEAPLERVGGQVFNVGSDEQNHTLQEVAEKIREVVPGASIIDSGSDSDRRNYRVSFQKLRSALNFTPEWQLVDGIRQVVDALHEGRVVDYRDPSYSNVRFLTEEGISKLVRREFGSVHDVLKQGEGSAYAYPSR